MEIEYGAEVIDRNGKVLGTVDYLVRNTWTGQISKFMVRPKAPNIGSLMFSPKDVLEATGTKIRLSMASNEIREPK